MSLTSALSNLPRELRDQVYGHLTTDQIVIWGGNHGWSLFPPLLSSVASITLHGTPILDQQLDLGHLKHEYDAQLSRMRTSATIRVGTYANPYARAHDESDVFKPTMRSIKDGSTFQALREQFCPVDQVTIFINCGYDRRTGSVYHQPGERHWDSLQYFLRYTTGEPAHFKRFRVAMYWSTWGQNQGHEYPNFTTPDGCRPFLPAPPPEFANLPIVQRGEAYRLYNDPGSEWNSERDQQNVVTKIAWYAFGEGAGWEPGEVEEEWPLPRDHEVPLPGEVEFAPRFGLEFVSGGSREKRGHNEAVAWF